MATNAQTLLLIAWWTNFCSIWSRDRPIFGFYRYIGIGQNGRYYRPR